MKIKSKELSGVALDWAVAKCDGINVYMLRGKLVYIPEGSLLGFIHKDPRRVEYSTNWLQGGPIIDKLIEDGWKIEKADFGQGIKCYRFINGEIQIQYGKTALIAVTRCYVADKLGDEIEVPDEFVNCEVKPG
jgi:hypothetical protein